VSTKWLSHNLTYLPESHVSAGRSGTWFPRGSSRECISWRRVHCERKGWVPERRIPGMFVKENGR